MSYVYRLQSIKCPQKHYIGFTSDLRQRLLYHNYGKVPATASCRPWKIVFYAAFNSEDKAFRFERYLKSGSGIAFAKKRLW
ncbi:MAG: GIY-YIG nuclease family protein [Puniceicoccaceae bacterium]